VHTVKNNVQVVESSDTYLACVVRVVQQNDTDSGQAAPGRAAPHASRHYALLLNFLKAGGCDNFPLDFYGIKCYIEFSLQLTAFKSSPERLEREKWTK